jgi:integrase
MELELWQNRLLEKYKPLTVQRYRSIFYTLFTRAFQNNLVTKNPFDSITAPKMRNNQIHLEKSDVMNPFTQLEINTLVEADDDTYMINFILLMANSGIRPGELIALTWKDINFVEKTININKTIISGSIGLPKTQSSIRVIDMISGAYIALKNQYRLTGNVEYVFLNSKNKIFFNHDIININFKKRLRIHNIPVRPLYQLRHSFASRMIKNGIDITWVSKTLGHKDSAITLKVYTKFIQEDNETRLKNITKINQKLEQLAQVGNMETSLEIATISTNIDKKEIK